MTTRSPLLRSLTLGALLLALASPACTARGGGGGGGGGGVSCGDAEEAQQSCYQAAGLGETFTSLYCAATDLEPGANGYMGPDTDWRCFVDAWSYDCTEAGPFQGQEDSAECDVDDGSVGDDDDSAMR